MLARAIQLRTTISARILAPLIAMAPKRKQTSAAVAGDKKSPRKSPRAAKNAGPSSEDPPSAATAAAAAAVVAEAADPPSDAPPAGAEAAAAAPAAPPAKKKRTAAPKPPPGPVFDHTMRPQPLEGPGFRILSWNVAGLRALLKEEKKIDLGGIAEGQGADVVCLQEIKLQAGKQVEECSAKLGLGGWHATWNCSADKKGYSGTAILSRHAPLSVTCGIGQAEHDGEGRVVTAEFEDFYLVNVYVPNSGDGLKRLEYRISKWDKDFCAYLQRLGERKGVVLTGDINCAHQEIDIHNPKGNLRSAGFTQEERDSFASNLLGECKLVDAFRRQYPEVVGYTYWGYRFNARANNKGWRLDYFLVSEGLWDRVHECYHMPEQLGSDHCPLVLVMKPAS